MMSLPGKPIFFGQQFVGPVADRHFVIDFGGLPRFVEGHHHDGGAVAASQSGVVQKRFFAFLQADRVDNRLALHAFQPGLDHRPFRAIDHDRHAGDLRLGGQQIQKLRHHRFAVEQGFVHIHVEHVRAAFDLLPSDAEARFELAVFDEPGEFLRAGDVGPLADHHEIDSGRIVSGSKPLSRVSASTFGRRRGGRFSTASAIALMCGGVVPQQPPTMFSQPLRANSPSSRAIDCGVSSKPPNAFGKPALG